MIGNDINDSYRVNRTSNSLSLKYSVLEQSQRVATIQHLSLFRSQRNREPLPPKRKLKVLVVDDSSYNLFVMSMILEEFKDMELEVLTALNGQRAVDTVLQHQERRFDIIFLDLQMPVMDGYDVYLFLH